ncbi:MAG: cupin domain-containing protein [Spirosomataceae bacterium]
MKNLYKILSFCCFAMQVFGQNPLPEMKSGVIYWDSLKVKSADGKHRRLLQPQSSTTHLKLFSVHATTQDAGTKPNPPHPNKDADELLIIKEGKIKFTIGSQTKIMEAGDVAVVLADEMHGLENVGDTQATYYVFRYQSKNPTDLERGRKAGGSLLLKKSELPFKPHDKGGRRDFYNRPITQCSVFEMHSTALNAGLESHQPHTHATEEALLITKGTVTMVIDCKIYQAKAGDLVLLGSNIPHALINTSGTQCEYFAFTWR